VSRLKCTLVCIRASGQFYQRFTRSFYEHYLRSKIRNAQKKTVKCHFVLLGPMSVKAARKLLMKSNQSSLKSCLEKFPPHSFLSLFFFPSCILATTHEPKKDQNSLEFAANVTLRSCSSLYTCNL